jgi:2-methylisocitrate lyase-like PEP mutase family enzyme
LPQPVTDGTLAERCPTEAATGATELLRLHQDPELLTVVNVWDVISTKVVSGVPGTVALATAGPAGRWGP